MMFEELKELKLMFPDAEEKVIQEIFESNRQNLDKTINDLLDLNDSDPFATHSLSENPSYSQEQADEALARMLYDEEFAKRISLHEELKKEVYGSKLIFTSIPNYYAII
jgi:hypothetical protein